MSCESTTTALLRAGGFRATWQRQLIATALRHADGHKTAQQILDDIRVGHPMINASTVYRTLSSFRDRGLVSETDLGTGEASYSWLGDDRHHHLICRACRVTIELGHELMGELRTAILLEHGFEATIDHFAIFGLCRECAASGA